MVAVTSVLDGWAIFPPGFDKEHAKAGAFPLLVHVYGEPAGTTVTDSFGGYQYLWHRLMAQRGYVVSSNRTSPRCTDESIGFSA